MNKLTLAAFALFALFPDELSACLLKNLSFDSNSNELTISGDVTCTFTDIAEVISNESILALESSNDRTWLLSSSILLESGATLEIHGASIGGDTDVLKMKSDSSGFVSIIADWGQVDIRSTKIESWDLINQNVDTNLEDGRSFITVRSKMGDDGTPNESRLDVIDSEIAYLGYFAGESYGLTWKVADDDFENVNVYGDIRNSYLHHNHRGHYSWGAFGSVLDNNEVAYSVEYGLDPHDDSDELIITNNYIHHSGSHGVICSKRCDSLVIADNVIDNNDNGIMLHSEMVDSIVARNLVTNSRNTGIVVYDSYDNVVRGNTIENNHIGLRALVGSYGNLFENNIVRNNERYGLFVLKGSALSETTDGRSSRNIFRGNMFENNPEGIFMLDSDDNQLINNSIDGVSEIFVKRGTGNILQGNIFSDAPFIRARGEEDSPSSTIIDNINGLELSLDQFSKVTVKGESSQLKVMLGKIGLANTFTSDGIVLSISGETDFLTGELVDEAFWVDAQEEVTVYEVDMDTSSNVTWKVISTKDQIVSFELGNVAPSRDYKLTMNGDEVEKISSNSFGNVIIEVAIVENVDTLFRIELAQLQNSGIPSNPNQSENTSGGTVSSFCLLFLGLIVIRRRQLEAKRTFLLLP